MISALALTVKDFCDRNGLLLTDNIIVGLSGGPDSVCLLSVLCELSKEKDVFPKIYAFHLNHGLRGDEALRDEKISVDLCKRLGIPVEVAHEDIKAKAAEFKRGEEETGRIVRYDLMRKFAASLTGSYAICVAHHRDDLTETFLMNVFRGAGLQGLISPKASSEDIQRPLLSVSKDEILSYLKANGLTYGTDSTNNQNDYTRNRWRNEILPLISEVSVKDPGLAVSDTVSLLDQDLSFLEETVSSVYESGVLTDGKAVIFPEKIIVSSHPAIGSRLIRRLWKDTFGDLTDFGRIHTEKVMKMCSINDTLTLDMPFQRKAVSQSGYLFFKGPSGEEAAEAFIARLKGFVISFADVSADIDPFTEKNTDLPQTDIQITTEIIENIAAVRYNTKSWFVPVYGDGISLKIRNDVAGLYFKKAGSSSGKVLRHLLSDKKVPSCVRDKVLAVTTKDRVLWVPGIGHAEGFTDEPSRLAHEAGIREKPLHYLKVTIG
ncbi:MAG: tRNA lysidine(34) synthetase TilS [Clostridiales bacterium]|nr:tRNA lysidine(34) synthetase TilS [Clostridiales bacterium]